MQTFKSDRFQHRIRVSHLRWTRLFTIVYLTWLVNSPALAQQVTFAVWDFDIHTLSRANSSGVAQYTRALPEILAQQLMSYQGTHVVERSKLREILDEQKLGSSSLADEDTRIRLGRLSGARHMIFGSALSIGAMTRLDVRLVSVETSQVEASFEISGAPAELPEQMSGLAKDLMSNLLGAALAQSGKPAGGGGPVPTGASTLALFDTGLAKMDLKDFEGAIETFKQVLTQAPGFVPAERNIRIALTKLSTQ